MKDKGMKDKDMKDKDMTGRIGKRGVGGFLGAVEYLLGVPRFAGGKHSLEEIRGFMGRVGIDGEGMKVVHVAGTNGKGSVCAYLGSVLRESGARVGVFSSPHLVDIRERIAVDGRMVGEEEFLGAFLQVYEGLDWGELEQGRGYHPTFFEFLFLMAMVVFKERGVEYCVLETGLGGRLDATNALLHKELTVISRIGRDHMQYLGESRAEIAGEKAGILRPGVPLVCLDEGDEVTAVLREKAREVGAPVYTVSKNDYGFLNFKNKRIDFSFRSRYYGYIRLNLHTTALYQMENAALAVRALELLVGERRITAAMVQAGIAGMYWPGRMEEVLPGVYVDGAHNVDGISALLETVRQDGFDGRRKLLFAVAADKDYDEMLGMLVHSGCFGQIVIAGLKSARSVTADSIRKTMTRYPGCAYTWSEDAGTALHALLADREGERIYIAGSLYLAGEIKEYLK